MILLPQYHLNHLLYFDLTFYTHNIKQCSKQWIIPVT
uniref:Uncharacterized protein n=1 Tax=Arundo donax TaxID=35708 RepID=A0A0A9CPP6_ARUDO